MTDATPSNAGDRYHFVYVARKMLEMLHPRSDLQILQMENVSNVDQALADDSGELLGVDLTEYYGGRDFVSARKSIIVQVKYSATQPNTTWTLNRLCRNKKNSSGTEKLGSSVIRKMADAFSVAYRTLGDDARKKIEVKIYSNQALEASFQENIATIYKLFQENPGLSDFQIGQLLNKLKGDIADFINELKDCTDLSWKQFSAFLQCWDIKSFGQSSAIDAEIELFHVVEQYVDGGIHFDNLINFVFEHALPNHRTSIDKGQVYGLLRISENNLFPARAIFPSDNLIPTENISNLVKSIGESSNKFILIHGVSGTGKSSTLRFLKKYYSDNFIAIIYDCYGGGENLSLSTGRFPLKKFLVQIINDLAYEIDTNIFATTRLDDDELLKRFQNAINKSSQLAAEKNKKLLIIVDALDDVIESALDHPNRKDDSFVPYLWKVSWPENCSILFSARTENLYRLELPINHTDIVIKGFNRQETIKFLSSYWPDKPYDLLNFTYERTNGNPRVQQKLILTAKREKVTDFHKFIDEEAKKTAFEYYGEQIPKRLKSESDQLLLAILREATQFINIETLAQVSQQSVSTVRLVIERLYFGLQITSEDLIIWSDKDFVNFIRGFAPRETLRAQNFLANFCQENYTKSRYANQYLSRHLYLAKEYRRLIDWWFSEDRLLKRIDKVSPYFEDIYDDLQYTLLASLEIEDFKSAIILLSFSGEIFQGVDIFAYAIRDHLDAVVESQYLNRLLLQIEKKGVDTEAIPIYFELARIISENPEQISLATELAEKGFSIIKSSKQAEHPKELSITAKAILNLSIYFANTVGLMGAFRELKHWQPQEAINYVLMDLIYEYSKNGKGPDVLQILHQSELPQEQRLFCLLGLLKTNLSGLEIQTYKDLAIELLDSVHNDRIRFGKKDPFDYEIITPVEHIINCLLIYNFPDIAKLFLPNWVIENPKSDTSNILEFLRKKAIEEVLKIATFQPASFEFPKIEKEENISPNQKQDRQEELQKMRFRMDLLYPSLLYKTIASVADDETQLLEAIKKYLPKLAKTNKPYANRFFRTDIREIIKNLIRTILSISGNQLVLLQEIISVSISLLGDDDYVSCMQYADALSSNEKYFGIAERLIHNCIELLTPPTYKARDIVEELLNLYPIAKRIDQSLAQQIFIKARIAASDWDWRVDGLAFALLNSLDNSDPIGKISLSELNNLARVFLFFEKITDGEDVDINIDRFIQQVTKIDPIFALRIISRADRKGAIDLTESINPMGLGLLDTGKIPPESIYPLINIGDNWKKSTQLLQKSIIAINKNNGSIDVALSRYINHIEKEVSRNYRLDAAQEFIQWCKENKFESSPDFTTMVNYSEELNRLLQNDTSKIDIASYHSEIDKGNKQLISNFWSAYRESPDAGLKTLEQIESKKITEVNFSEIHKILVTLADALPSSACARLFGIIEKYASDQYEPYAFSLMSEVACKFYPSDSIRSAYSNSLTNLLTARNLQILTRPYYQQFWDDFIKYCPLRTQDLLKLILHATTCWLGSLSADDLFRLTGLLCELLKPQDSQIVFNSLLARCTSKLKDDSEEIEPTNIEPFVGYIRFLIDKFQHPEISKRWNALYCLLEIILNIPDVSLSIVIAELKDTRSERWVTKLEWLLLLLHHISIRYPLMLIQYKDQLIQFCLSKKFPHAKIRYHSKEILLNFEAAKHNILTANEIVQILQVNEPIAFTTDDQRQPSQNLRNYDKEGSRFDFDSLDTLPYWYTPLDTVFGEKRPNVAEIAYKWIVDELGITNENCNREEDWTSSRFDWAETSHNHGSFPKVDTLRTYAELHGLFLAAGELIDSTPVVIDKWNGDEWKDWTRYHLRLLDPLLPSRNLRGLPLAEDNFGIFSKTYEEWVKKDDDADFEKELWIDNDRGWIVVQGDRSGSFAERKFSVSVNSYLIHPKTARAFARLIRSQDDRIATPHTDGLYDSVILEIVKDLTKQWEEITFSDDIDNYPFILKGWIIEWYQEMPFHSNDPKWANLGRKYSLFTPPFYSSRGVRFDPITFDSYTKDGERIAYYEQWHDLAGPHKHAILVEGNRLAIKFDYLVSYLHEIDMNLVITVRLSRSRPYEREFKRGEDYDRGKIMSFVLNASGELEIVMDDDLTQKGNKLAQELSKDNRSTLDKWMAHYLVELMERANSPDCSVSIESRKECAEIIIRLWQQKIDEEALHVRNDFWEMSSILTNDDNYELLSNALVDPDVISELDEKSWTGLYHSLSKVEDKLLLLLSLSSTSAADEGQVNDEAIEKFLKNEHNEIVDSLARIFPDVKKVNLKDYDRVNEQVEDALRKIYSLRSSLLWTAD